MQKFMLRNSVKGRWVLEDERQHELLTMQSESHWTKVNYEYKVSVKEDISVDTTELLIACGYGTNLHMSMVAALII